MTDCYDRSDRFELIAACDGETLVEHADAVLGGESEVRVLQAPTPELIMHRVTEPVEVRPFNLGEVLVTAAEVTVDGEKGFAVVPGKAEKPALSGAIVDAAVESGHERADEMIAALEETGREAERQRHERWGRVRETTVDFEEMEELT
jgi:alpha-D-ribose 1-methylphosphonate 5-triphosphate synthase subunit PhnG